MENNYVKKLKLSCKQKLSCKNFNDNKLVMSKILMSKIIKLMN